MCASGITRVKRKQWSQQGMEAAVAYVKEEEGSLREAARLYDVPIETLRRRVIGAVKVDCRPGPNTILTTAEESQLVKYIIDMSDMGYGLSREDVMVMGFKIAERAGRQHPFKDGTAGCGWYDGFIARHNLKLYTAQPLSYARALCSSKEVVDDFFAKLGAVYGRLNLISKPMNIFNVDETGIGIVHKVGKVVAEVGRHKVHSLTSAEKGRTHTVVTCVSASGNSLPPLMIYPRKRRLPEKARVGAVAGTVFMVSDNGWINREIYLEWFKLFLQSIPSSRPVLLLQDGHYSHISVELIELAKANDIHLMCLPAHTSHILQPLDVGVFKSFKSFFSKSCHEYMMTNPGRVITTDVLASLVGKAWPQSLTPLNILSGFRKCGIYPFNPGEVSDRQTAPSRSVTPQPQQDSQCISGSPNSPLFTEQQEAIFKKRYQEGYNINDPDYVAWLKLHHPCSVSSLSMCSSQSLSSSHSELSDILVLPQPPVKSYRQKRQGFNQNAVLISEDTFLCKLKEKEDEKQKEEAKKKQRKQDREQKRQEKKKEAEEKRKEREKKKVERKKKQQEIEMKKDGVGKQIQKCADQLQAVCLSDSDSVTVCPLCGDIYGDNDDMWICCDICDHWYDFRCVGISQNNIPDIFHCKMCNEY